MELEGKIIFPELSYAIIGLAYDVFNDAGYGMREKYYQRAYAIRLENKGINFEKEKRVKLLYQNRIIGYYYYDFLIENKVVVELKVRPRFGYSDIKQVMSYLKAKKLKLAILIYFTRDGVKYRRIINIDDEA